MCALRSSSALAVNLFEYWRSQDLGTMAKACGFPSRNIASMQFERLTAVAAHVDRGVFRRDPNIDVVVTYKLGGLKEVGIECKFSEAYGLHKPISKAYLEWTTLWDGIPNCREFAEQNLSSGRAQGVDHAQLLKHVLGLKNRNGLGKFWLVYIWYAVPHPATALHQEQLARFREILHSDGIPFRSITYQEIIQRMWSTLAEEHREYVSYLTDRYF